MYFCAIIYLIRIYSTMKYLIIGLGNIGATYENTRHNIGFDVVDALCKNLDGVWRSDHHGDRAEVKWKGRALVLLKPDTYMNLSGKAVRYWLNKEKVELENCLVICDDLNLDFGKIRLRPKGSDGGHNGLKSIQELLGTDAYPRLRMGIGDNFSQGKQVNFVLGKWTEAEKADLYHIIDRAIEVVKIFTTLGLERAMNATTPPRPKPEPKPNTPKKSSDL
jgi:peptidyl-tRNA hydrolase, PTH1 family